jgi:hypothetical protein
VENRRRPRTRRFYLSLIHGPVAADGATGHIAAEALCSRIEKGDGALPAPIPHLGASSFTGETEKGSGARWTPSLSANPTLNWFRLAGREETGTQQRGVGDRRQVPRDRIGEPTRSRSNNAQPAQVIHHYLVWGWPAWRALGPEAKLPGHEMLEVSAT